VKNKKPKLKTENKKAKIRNRFQNYGIKKVKVKNQNPKYKFEYQVVILN
jgi:hypothetical protein